MNGIPTTQTEPWGGLAREGLAVAGGLALLLALPVLALVQNQATCFGRARCSS